MATTFKRGEDQKVRGSRWMVNFFDATLGKRRTIRGYSDRDASQAMGERLERDAARKAEGLLDPVDDQARRPIGEHIDDYVAMLRGKECSATHVAQVVQRLGLVAKGVKAARLVDLDATKVLTFLTVYRSRIGKRGQQRPLSTITKNNMISTLKSLTRWALESRRILHDPLVGLRKIQPKAVVLAHPRRALTPEEAGRLLDAAERRPLQELLTVRTGANVGRPLAKVGRSARDRAAALGRERRVSYFLAIWAGLRRSEAAELRWGDLSLDSAVPHIKLRAETTKAGRGDTLALHPQLAETLRGHRPAAAKPSDRVVATVPNMNVVRADLKFAGIDPGTRATGFVDFHSLRMTLSTMMAVGGMSQRARQAQMRHSDPRLTENVYMDVRLLPVAAELQRLPDIPGGGQAATPTAAGRVLCRTA